MPKINVRGGPSHAAAGVPRAYSRPVGAPPAATPPAAERPDDKATKAAWVAYAEKVGVDPSGLTKAELIETVG